ncbi:hypothetical protein CVT26_007258 [Gymnopilus dilepis]|uniref:Uncharacterized protein n=1 Tax=Gymnopilus dilepis TaxID=231916 RepID=A0A409VM79_9AGAR|nr:hypothetical protein CVT26_007258 [Gymnopilus dilepis]
MRTILYILLSSTFVNFVCNALPLPGVYDPYNYDARDFDDLIKLEARARSGKRRANPVGPGARYPEDDPTHPQSTYHSAQRYSPVPPNHYYQTANHVWTHHDVNAQANQFLDAIDHAPTANSNKKRKNTKTYPKPTSGFRSSEAHRDPTDGYPIRYHQPMGATPGNAPHNAHTGRTSLRVGTDRLLAYRHPHEDHFHLGVSYHDPHQPIPSTSHNHPFSEAPRRRGGGFKVGFTKAKKKLGSFFKFGKKKDH